MTKQPPTRGSILRAVIALVFFCAAPTAGDIGGCGQSGDELDPATFFLNKAEIDCEQCGACGLMTQACAAACAGQFPADFAPGCVPLVHDGEVCLDALLAASCDDYRSFAADIGSTTPSECDFCPVTP